MGSIDIKLYYKSVGLVVLLLFTTNCVLTTSSDWIANRPEQPPKLPLLKQEGDTIMDLLALTEELQMECNSLSDPQCDEETIFCDKCTTTFCHVIGLDLRGCNLNGRIPPQVGNLAYLTRLDLGGNKLRGSIPASFVNLQSLYHLDVSDNSLRGNLSPFQRMSSLQFLDLLGNNFEGPLPTEISSMESLVSLKFSNVVTAGGSANSFQDLRHMTSLRELTLRNCSLRGPIPRYIWELQSLQYLDLSFNELSGFVPNSINSSLTHIFLRKNKLNGILPAWLVVLTNTSNVNSSHRYVDVSENNFTLTTSVSDALPNQDVQNSLHHFSTLDVT